MFKEFDTFDLYLDQKVGLIVSCTSWTVEINGGRFVPACTRRLSQYKYKNKRLKCQNNVLDSSVKRSIYRTLSVWPTVILIGSCHAAQVGITARCLCEYRRDCYKSSAWVSGFTMRGEWIGSKGHVSRLLGSTWEM
jgi:hypothetical protein